MISWVDSHISEMRVGDVVKVKDNAYHGDVAEMHNGRICEILKVGHGDVVVCSIDDKRPVLRWTHHSPDVLQKVG
jgi:hypothetical protein